MLKYLSSAMRQCTWWMAQRCHWLLRAQLQGCDVMFHHAAFTLQSRLVRSHCPHYCCREHACGRWWTSRKSTESVFADAAFTQTQHSRKHTERHSSIAPAPSPHDHTTTNTRTHSHNGYRRCASQTSNWTDVSRKEEVTAALQSLW